MPSLLVCRKTPLVEFLKSVVQQEREENAEECWCEGTSLFDTTLYGEGLAGSLIEADNTLHDLMKGNDDAV